MVVYTLIKLIEKWQSSKNEWSNILENSLGLQFYYHGMDGAHVNIVTAMPLHYSVMKITT